MQMLRFTSPAPWNKQRIYAAHQAPNRPIIPELWLFRVQEVVDFACQLMQARAAGSFALASFTLLGIHVQHQRRENTALSEGVGSGSGGSRGCSFDGSAQGGGRGRGSRVWCCFLHEKAAKNENRFRSRVVGQAVARKRVRTCPVRQWNTSSHQRALLGRRCTAYTRYGHFHTCH